MRYRAASASEMRVATLGLWAHIVQYAIGQDCSAAPTDAAGPGLGPALDAAAAPTTALRLPCVVSAGAVGLPAAGTAGGAVKLSHPIENFLAH